MRLMGLGKSVKEVKPLNEEMAVELGAEMLGEIVIFSVGSAIIAAEYARQARKEQHKEDVQNDRICELEGEIREMGLIVERNSAEVREMTRLIASLNLPVRSGLPDKIKDPKSGVTLQVQH